MNILGRVSILVLVCFVAFAAAQQREFDVVLTLEGTSSRIDRKESAAKVRIVNRSESYLETATLPELNIYFAACQASDPSCLDSSLYFATVEIPARRLAENESIEFKVPLSGLQWTLGPYRRGSGGYFRTDLSGIPKTNIFLYADVKIPDGFIVDPDGAKRPKFRESVSNVLVVSFE